VKYRFAAILLFSASVHGPAATAGQTAAGNGCQTVSGVIYLSADDGIILSEGKTRYQINGAPHALEQISVTNLVEGVRGTYEICRTGAHDRFGSAVVNILRFANLTFNKEN
jgi:hypothetical protein